MLKKSIFLLILTLMLVSSVQADLLTLGVGKKRTAAGGGATVAHRTTWVQSTPSATCSVTTSTTAGDTLVAWAVSDATGTTATWPSGFTQVAAQDTTTDGQTLLAAIKVNATGSEGSQSITSSSNLICGISSFSGANTTTQPDVTTVVASNNTGQASPWTIGASITPVTSGSALVAIMGSDVTDSADPVHTFSDTGGLAWTTVADISSGFPNVGVGVASQTTAAATTVTGTGTVASVSAGRSMILIAVRP